MLLAHFDWSVDPRKRWGALARLRDDGSADCAAPEPAGPLDTLFGRLRADEPERPILAGFDFPIGLPAQYAERAGIRSFVEALPLFPMSFYEPVDRVNDISTSRPFYPRRPGSRRKEHLLSRLGVDSLLRECEKATRDRGRACELFWTLGPNQVGRGAALAWSRLLGPGLCRGEILIWPFHGELPDLLATGQIVVAECYPAEVYSHLSLPRRFGKTRLASRQKQAPAILSWCEGHQVRLTPDLRSAVENGFDQDDAFDAFLGVLGLIEVARGDAPHSVPARRKIRAVEGWILGMRHRERRTSAD